MSAAAVSEGAGAKSAARPSEPASEARPSETASRVALVTGESRGIGRGVALALAGAGFDVVVNYARNAEAAERVAAEITALGPKAPPVQADISSAADRQQLVAQAYAAFGRVDVLVNNAGVAPDVRADVLEA